MSKFQELCESYKTTRQNYFSYRDECLGFVNELVHRYKNYLEIPEGQFSYVPTHKEPEPGKTYSLDGASHLNADGYWHSGLEIRLYEAPNVEPQATVRICLRVKKQEDKFDVKITSQNRHHIIASGNLQEHTEFFEYLQKQIRDSMEKEMSDFLTRSSPLRKIGFE